MDYIAILGRQHELGLAELETLYGPRSITPINKHSCFVNQVVDFQRIGSSVKFTRHIETIASHSVEQALDSAMPYILDERQHRQGKLQLGVSVYGTRISPSKISRSALTLKKKLRSKGLSVRLIPNKHQELNAAQILNNKLHKENGIEINIIVDGKRIHLARTLEVQDIDEYAHRDREKPVRDPLVGMLPPKLAQTLINLTDAKPSQTLLDPFCGTGTVLMEAFAMGIDSQGSDISPDMVEATRVNMNWFSQNKKSPKFDVALADATHHQWQVPIDVVAAETYLGPPLRSIPSDNELNRIVDEVDDIHREFLHNLAPQLKTGARLALAVPAWYEKTQFTNLACLDDLEKLGYNPSSFVHISGELVYHRPNQVVGRRILNLVRK